MSEPTPLPGRGIKPLVSLRAHPRLALAAFVLVLAVGLPVAWKKGEPRYFTEASVQVAPRYMRNLREDQEVDFQSNTQYRQFVEHQRRTLSRYDILRDALASLGERRAVWQRPEESERRAVERLRDRLQVSSVPDTYLIRVGLEDARPEGLAEVVNAVTSTFIARMKTEEIYGSDERTGHLRRRERELLDTIARLAGERSGIAQQLSLTTFNEGTPNPYDRLVADLRAQVLEAGRRRMDAQAALAAFQGHGDTGVTVRSVQDAVLNDPGLNSLKGALATRRAALLVQKSGLRGDHPGAVAAERELAEIDGELTQQHARLEGRVRDNLRARLAGTAEQARNVEQGLQRELAALEAQAADYARLFQQARTLTADMDQARTELDKVRERINYLGIESTSFGFLRLASPALAPDLPFGPGRKKTLLMALLAALAAAVAAPVLRDLADRRVRTVNDVQRLLGIAPAGWQVDRTHAASEVFAEAQLRRLAATLMRHRDTRGQRVFGLTGCKPGAGTTTLTLELAATLRELGCKVLVVEANGQGRDARYASGRPGLVELLHGQARASEILVPADGSLPPRVAFSGPGALRPSSVQRLDRLGRALEHWAGQVDFVLVDMPPLLTSADAELLVRTIGQVLLVVQAGAQTQGEVRRAGRLLQAIDPAGVGVVVNRVAPFEGGGYLNELMLETVSGRRAEAVLSTPTWRLRLASLFLRPRRATA